MRKEAAGREHVRDMARGERYPHPLLSCLMPVIAVLALTLGGIVFFVVALQWYHPPDITVPDVEGRARLDAEAELQRVGLGVDISDVSKPSEAVNEGSVAETDPAPGRRVKQGRTVRLVLSSGSRYSVVPDVRELSQVEAQEKLVKAGLRVASEQYVYHDIIPYDRVIDVLPATGTRVDRNTAVAITLSEGPKPSEGDFMPDVRSTVVHVILPDDEPEAKIMRIDVWDNAGKHEGVYQEMQEPGKEVTQTVQGSGKMTVEVYYGERLIMTRKL